MKTVKISALSAAILLSSVASTGAWAADGETVVIGLAGPLTGPSARIGKDLENGAQLAIDDINKQHPTIGGKAVTFKLQSEDDQSDPRTAVAVAQRLVDSGVAGVVGHWNTGTSIPAARVYHDAGIAQVAPVATGHAYTKQGFDTSFRVMGHDDDGGQLAGQYAVNTLKAKRIAVIDDRTAFGQGLADQFIKSLEAQGVKVVDRQYVDDKTVDFSAVLTAIRSKNADLIFFGGVDSQAAPLARRIKQLGMNATLMGAGGFVSQTFLQLAQKQGEGVVALEPGLPVDQMPGGKAFEQAYQSRYHTHIELHAPFAYDATRVLVAAMEKADSVEPSDYLPALRAISYSGVTGQIAFDKEGNLKSPEGNVMSDNNELGILARRKIEAEIIKPIYEILVREIGKTRAQAVIGEAIEQAAIDAGKAFASKEPNGTDVKSFIALQYLWEKDNALDVKVIDADDQQYNYNVTRCRYAEMYHEMGLGEIGHLLSCARDEKFIVGYAPDVKLTRTTTIMQGGACCDFRYRSSKDKP
ncbi:hypothetical protein L1887_45606 [Cichorium endivia]|nr:hypothetical protein L1887_45606 [Cichorium endivia]